MDSDLKYQLFEEIEQGGNAYARNLATAEVAVLNGQFNAAKILRACAHSQRILAMEAARLVAVDFDAVNLFQTIITELHDKSALEKFMTAPDLDPVTQAKLERFKKIRERLLDIIRRALESLRTNQDVLESDVHQSLWGCYSCGFIAEENRPDTCPVCGALGVEFEWFGPFYAKTPEHLGQLTPAEILATLEAIPNQVANAISKTNDYELRRKPSKDEWGVKEIIGHIIETDLLFSQRVRFVLEGQGIPVIPRSMPPWKLHEGKGYDELPAAELLERLRKVRFASLELVRDLKPEHWIRQGILMGTANSVLDLGSWLTNHDRGHLAQIRRLCKN